MPNWYFLILAIALLLLCVVVSPLLAARKGYAWYLWILASGPLGLIVLAFLPFARRPEVSPELNQSRRQTGNTLGVVLSVIGLLGMVAIVIPVVQVNTVLRNAEEARNSSARLRINMLAQACESYKLDHRGAWPPNLAVLLEMDALGGPYLKTRDALIDPWGVQYEYQQPGANDIQPIIWCQSPNGRIDNRAPK